MSGYTNTSGIPKPHVWRYDASTPADERPWIVSYHDGKGDLLQDPDEFATWYEAVAAALEAPFPPHPEAGMLKVLPCQHPEEECPEGDHEFTPGTGDWLGMCQGISAGQRCLLEQPHRWDLNLIDYYGVPVTICEYATEAAARAARDDFRTDSVWAGRWTDYLKPSVGTRPHNAAEARRYVERLTAA